MIRIYLLLLIIIIAVWGLRGFLKAPPALLAKYIRKFLLGAAAIVMLYLFASGALNWLFALIGIFIAFVLRLMPLWLRYVPYLQRLWFEYTAAKQGTSQRQGSGGSSGSSGKMSKAEAYEVLGLKMGASAQEVIAAHRKLIQKIHPDRGGSDYLAAKINLAKKILLNK